MDILGLEGDGPPTVPFYERCGFALHRAAWDLFTTTTATAIREAGVQLRDMAHPQRSL